MKRTGLYIPEEVLICWSVYARIRGGRMSRNRVIEELARYSLCPHTLDVRVEVIERALEETQEETKKLDLAQLVRDGDW
jgi:hypothetical protein